LVFVQGLVSTVSNAGAQALGKYQKASFNSSEKTQQLCI